MTSVYFYFTFMYSLSTEGEDLRDQESVSRVLAELLDNQDGLFDSEDDDVSTTNDYSSINEQVLSFTFAFYFFITLFLCEVLVSSCVPDKTRMAWLHMFSKN